MGLVAKGTSFTWNSQTVAKLKSIGSPELNADMLDITTHQSTNGLREYLAGLKDWGEVAIEGDLDYTDTTGQVAMVTDAVAGTSRTCVITPPSSVYTLTFTGIINRIKFGDHPHDGLISFSAAIKVTGAVTLATTSVTGMSAVGFSNDVLMMPTFAIGKYLEAGYEYVVTITNAESSTIITPVDATEGEVITITAPDATTQVVSTGVASSAITISATADNVIDITISKSGYVSKTYRFHCAVLAA